MMFVHHCKQWKKTCSKDDKLGSEDLYKIYIDYQFELRKFIRAAKRNSIIVK